ncbi:MAG: glycosyltransferase family 2 protein [Oceanospirillaceae bacterium]|nr:glycosyltransferase family 2 protein [Oceanospirillaceae bacterium]
MTDSQSLSIVVPMYKEEDNAARLVERVHQGMAEYEGYWELVLVDDGSPDGTVKAIRQCQSEWGDHVRLIELQRNFGQTAAMQAGIDAARGELIVTMDGDLQNDPTDIPRMVAELLERDLDLLQGWRVNRQDAAIKRKLPSKIANRLIAKMTGVHLHDYGCSLKVYRASILKQVRLYGEMHRFIPVWVAGVTSPARIGETPVTHHAREFGESKYGISRTFRVILDLISVFFFLKYRSRPGHFFGYLGLSAGTIGGLLLSWLFFVKVFLGEDIGNRPMLMISVFLVLMAFQFLTTGVVAEMLSRIYFQGTDNRNFIVLKRPDLKPDDAWREPQPEKSE